MESFSTIKQCTYAKLNCFSIELIIYIKMDLALNNLQRLICHKTKQTNLPVDFGAMTMKEYSTFPKSSRLELHH